MIINAVSPDEAWAFLRIPSIWQCQIDGEPPATLPIPSVVGLFGAKCSNILAGLALTHPYRDGVKLHYYVLPMYRLKIARHFLGQLLETHIETRPVYAAIPTSHRAVINFAKHAGFEYLETERDAWRKNGMLHDREILRRCLL